MGLFNNIFGSKKAENVEKRYTCPLQEMCILCDCHSGDRVVAEFNKDQPFTFKLKVHGKEKEVYIANIEATTVVTNCFWDPKRCKMVEEYGLQHKITLLEV